MGSNEMETIHHQTQNTSDSLTTESLPAFIMLWHYTRAQTTPTGSWPSRGGLSRPITRVAKGLAAHPIPLTHG